MNNNIADWTVFRFLFYGGMKKMPESTPDQAIVAVEMDVRITNIIIFAELRELRGGVDHSDFAMIGLAPLPETILDTEILVSEHVNWDRVRCVACLGRHSGVDLASNG
jgi:hypothetical protein